MKSIADSIDGHSIAAQIRMERQTHKGAFLLLEGPSDALRFARFVDEGVCSIVISYGKKNAVDAIELLHDDGFVRCVGMVDADFDRILGNLPIHEGLIPSQTHDFDLDAATTNVFERYIREVGDPTKVESLGGTRKLLERIINLIKPLTALRFANVKHCLGYSLDNLSLIKFFDGVTFNISKMIEEVSWGKMSAPKQKLALKGHIDRYVASNIDLIQATSGHDFCEAFGIVLREVAGDRRDPQTWRSEIELHFRLAYDREHFAETEPSAALARWEMSNPPHRVLRKLN